jgi:hypothetical protein
VTDSTSTPVTGGGVRDRAGASAGGWVHLTERDVRALMWRCEMYGIRADLLATLLDASGDVIKQLGARWRRRPGRDGAAGPPGMCPMGRCCDPTPPRTIRGGVGA